MYLNFNIVMFLVAALIFSLIIYKKQYFKNRFILFFQIVMFLYIMAVIGLTQFPISINQNLGVNIWDSIYLIPFVNGVGLNSVLNIALSIPFGAILPFLAHNTMKNVILCLFFGISIEILQFLTALTIGCGFTYRYIELDDIIYNIIGGMIGLLLFIIFAQIFNRFKNNHNTNKFYQYIKYAVSFYIK